MVQKQSRRRNWRMWRDAFLLITPFTLLYLIFFIFPTFRVFQLSFMDVPLIGGGGEFIGLENYRELLTDSRFWSSVRHTFFLSLSCCRSVL